MLHGLVDCVVWDAKPAILVWVAWALIAVGSKLQQANPETNVPEG
jgi:hypothetical protein